MSKAYVEKRDGGYWLTGSRVTLDSIVYTFLEGLSPEAINKECFPVLTLEQVYGAITFYLANRDEIDNYLTQRRTDYETQRQAANKVVIK